MVTNDVADGLVAENARLRARLEEALANAQVYGERMLQAQNERDHAKRELAAANAMVSQLKNEASEWVAIAQAVTLERDDARRQLASRRRENTTAGTP